MIVDCDSVRGEDSRAMRGRSGCRHKLTVSPHRAHLKKKFEAGAKAKRKEDLSCCTGGGNSKEELRFRGGGLLRGQPGGVAKT